MEQDKLTIDLVVEAKEYWKNIFSEGLERISLANQYKKDKNGFNKYSFRISGEPFLKLRKITKNNDISIYTFLVTVLKIQLFKYSCQNNLLIGIPVYFKSNKSERANKIMPFKSTIDENNTFKEQLIYIKNRLEEFHRYQVCSIEEVVRENNIEGLDIGYAINVAMKNMHNIMHIDHMLSFENSEINFLIEKKDNYIDIEILYNLKFLSDKSIVKFAEIYLKIFNEVILNLQITLKNIDIIEEDEKEKILVEFNDTYADYPRNKTIHKLFEEQVEKRPDNIAVVFEDKELTYRELNEKANGLARTLRKKGVKPDTIVGIMVERSLEMIVGIIGILKSGGAYLPIDPGYPEDRIKYMLEDSETKLLLTEEHLLNKIDFEGELLNLQDENAYSDNGDNLDETNIPKDLAYVIYTSGSTGKPKGVMINHNALNNFAIGVCDRMNLSMYKNILCVTTITFDIFALETLVPLLKGIKIVMANETEQTDSLKLNDVIIKNNIEVLQTTPSRLQILMLDESFKESIKALKIIMVGGENFPKNLLIQLNNYSNIKIYNMYGPSETTVWSSIGELTGCEDINIGKPISNTQVYIIDRANSVQPIGVTGELCISGDGLARGYLNRLDLTAEKFVDNPFEVGTKMYKTGDLARWLPDGNIEFLGRIDHQVKMRGYRIELGEIESNLLTYEGVKETIVVDREEGNGSKYLCAYIVSEKELAVRDLRLYLGEKLPDYMIPSHFVQLDKMPLTPNGKVDRKSLPKPDGSIATEVEYEGPRNEVEEKLTSIWGEVLRVDQVGINDNFFELGGHSLKATILMSKIHKELNKEVPLKQLFKLPTIKGISEYIESTEKSIYSSIEKVEENVYYEASSAQKRMYLLQQFDLKSTGYNMPGVMVIEGSLDVEKLEKSFSELIRRHETLRTSFEAIEDKIVQRVNENVILKLEYFEENTDEVAENIVKDFVRAFDLSKAPILRVGLIELEKYKYILMYDMHHIISDGVSMEILIDEFAKIYEGKELDGLRIQYKDFAAWQNNFLKSEEMRRQKEYWINRFSYEIPVLNMPTDFKRPQVQSFEGDSISFELDKKLTESLRKIAKETGSTMYMVLLSGVNILLSKYSGQDDIIVGSPIAGRPHADFEKIIGMFVNTIAMRNHSDGSMTYEDFLKKVKENALEAYENQDYQFDELVDKLSIPRDISRNPLFDVMFTMQNIGSEDIKLKDLVFKGYKQETKVAKFDLTLSASELEENIILNFLYSTKLYKKETIERMVNHFINILKVVTEDTKVKLNEIEMLSEAEKHKLLYEFNDTYADYPKDKTIHELFEEQVEKTPDNVDVVFEDKKLTYRELNERANRLARTLREKGVKSDTIVGIMVERSLEMIVGIMGILKAGAAYLPIDPGYPEDRIKYMLEDSETKLLLTEEHLLNKVDFEGKLLSLQDENVYSNNGDNLDEANTPKDLAYIIYTSGTTGKSKGVLVEHRNVIRLMFNSKNPYNFNSNDVWTMFHSYCFDFSVWEMYGALLYGGKLVIVSKDITIDFKEFLKILKKEEVTILNQIPTPFYSLMNEELNCRDKKLKLRYIIFGGEMLKPEALRRWVNKYPDTRVVNMYGITETTVHVTYKEIEIQDIERGVSNIGKPIPTLTAYVMDNNLKLQPTGVPGEICVGGDGVCRGYLNRKKLTEEKFVNNPYKIKEIIYRSGDLGKVLSNGDIEYLGRIDNQVKIRGFRIELGEIESNLLTYEGVKEVIVVDREDENKSKYLCAYIVSEKELKVGEVRAYLLKQLPEYMIPSYFVQLNKMPLTLNGKIDKKALPEPDGSIVTETEYEGPKNEVQEKLVVIWKDILKVERIGINDNFFELGGHSLKATMLIGKIYKEFNIEVPLKIIFKVPNIKELSKCILNKETFTAYKDYSESSVVIKLNKSNTKNIFLFPPILGYGIGYNEFAKYIENYTLYSFDFNEDENRASEYVRQITSIQKEGKYTLMGYSAGGNLGFEVAKELENRGYEVSDIILLDSEVKDKKVRSSSLDSEEINYLFDELNKYVDLNAPFMKKDINLNIQRKSKKFILYWSEMINSGKINANIHLISSLGENIFNGKLKKKNKWAKLTKKNFKVYKGYGTHNEMITPNNSKLNAQIINKIIN